MKKRSIIKYVLLALLSLSFASSCNKQHKKTDEAKANDTKVHTEKDLLKVYEKQIRAYYEELSDVGMDGIEVMPCKSQVEYTDIAIELIYEALKRTGFRSVDNETARKAILKYYGVDISQNNTTLAEQGFLTYIFKNGKPTERKRQNIAMNSAFYEKPIYFWDKNIYVPGYNYITFYPTIEQVVDIKGLADIDQEGADPKTIKHGKLYFGNYNKLLFYENEFIFHDSKKAFEWLKENDSDFLVGLLSNHGYDKNEDINKIAINQIQKEYASSSEIWMFHNTIVCKRETKHPHVEIREGLLKSILKLPATEGNKEWEIIFNKYIDLLLDQEEEDTIRPIANFTKKERYKIAAYLCYYLYKISKKNGYADTSLLGHALYYNHAFYKYIVDQHYFNLPGFEALCYKVYDDYDIEVKIRTHQDE